MDTASSSEGIKGPRRSKLESNLRQLEVDAYCALISVFRAQGELTWKKESILQDLRQLLRISDERHKMELKRVREDENLCEIARLSAGLHYEAEIESIGGDKARQSKKQKTNWAVNKDQSVAPLDVVAAPASAHPNYNKTPGKDTKPKGKPQSKAKPPPKAAAKGETRKRKPAAGKKGGSKVKPKPKPEEEFADVDPIAAMEAEEEAEEVDEAEAARIKEIEASLKAKQEQLRAELAALHASMSEPNGEEGPEVEEGGAETAAGGGAAAETTDEATGMEQAPVSGEEAEVKEE